MNSSIVSLLLLSLALAQAHRIIPNGATYRPLRVNAGRELAFETLLFSIQTAPNDRPIEADEIVNVVCPCWGCEKFYGCNETVCSWVLEQPRMALEQETRAVVNLPRTENAVSTHYSDLAGIAFDEIAQPNTLTFARLQGTYDKFNDEWVQISPPYMNTGRCSASFRNHNETQIGHFEYDTHVDEMTCDPIRAAVELLKLTDRHDPWQIASLLARDEWQVCLSRMIVPGINPVQSDFSPFPIVDDTAKMQAHTREEIPPMIVQRTPANPIGDEQIILNDIGTVVGQTVDQSLVNITFFPNPGDPVFLCLPIESDSFPLESPFYTVPDFAEVVSPIQAYTILELDITLICDDNADLSTCEFFCANITDSGQYVPIVRLNDTMFPNWNNITVDVCNVYEGDNTTCDDCLGNPAGPAVVDACGVCNGTNSTCLDCNGVPNGGATFDPCGICGGSNDTCYDCFGTLNGTAVFDQCNVCNGTDACLDCTGAPFGSAVIDVCGICDGPNNGPLCQDCFGEFNGTAVIDACGVCNGTNSTCADCNGVPNGNSTLDECGVCDGDNSTCLDCGGTPNGCLVVDACGVCGGDNSTCEGCDCVPNSGLVDDVCGVCGGDNSTCIGCDGFPSIPITVRDVCGVCGGDGTSCNITVDPFCVNVSCSANGVCEFGVGTCQCFSGFMGADCSEIDHCCNVTCGVHGECDVTDGSCICAPGYSGAMCDIEDLCFEVDCGTYGTCNSGTGECQCTSGRTGCRCTELNCGINGFYSPVDDECVCLAGYTGTLCDTCQSASFDGKTFICVANDALDSDAKLYAVPNGDLSLWLAFYGSRAFTLDDADSRGFTCNCLREILVAPIATGSASDQCERRTETLNERAHVQIERLNNELCDNSNVLVTELLGVVVPREESDCDNRIVEWWIVWIILLIIDVALIIGLLVWRGGPRAPQIIPSPPPPPPRPSTSQSKQSRDFKEEDESSSDSESFTSGFDEERGLSVDSEPSSSDEEFLASAAASKLFSGRNTIRLDEYVEAKQSSARGLGNIRARTSKQTTAHDVHK